MKLLRSVYAKIKANKLEVAIVATVLLVLGIAHAVNMFHFPYYEDDEGTYMAQAWSFAQHAKLAPGTYWYDHAPLGWMFISLWIKLTGVFTFGFSVNSGRVFILILFLLSAAFVYFIGRKLTNSKAMAVLAALLYGLAPLTIALQRRVLLDNIMVFWLLASIILVLYSKQKLGRIILSGLLFGIACLSKESAAVFLPVLVYLVWAYTDKQIRKQAVTTWVLVGGLFIFLYPLMAIVKGELLPAAYPFLCDKSHESLIETLGWQAGRGSALLPLYKQWFHDGPLIMFGGILSIIVALILGIWKKSARTLAFLGISYVLFLLRGGMLFYYYILPLVPFLSLAVAYVIWFVAQLLKKWKLLAVLPYLLFTGVSILIWSAYNQRQFHDVWYTDQTSAQVRAVGWMLEQHTPTRFYAIDMYGYIDLNANNQGNFKYAEYYWKVADDPTVFEKVLHDNYKNIDYIMSTSTLSNDTQLANLYLMAPALKDSQKVGIFTDSGGYDVTVYKVNNLNYAAGQLKPKLYCYP